MESVRTALSARWEGDSLKSSCLVCGHERLYVQPPDRDDFPTFECGRGCGWRALREALVKAGVPNEALRGNAGQSSEAVALPSATFLLDSAPALLRSGKHPEFLEYLHGLGLSTEQVEREGVGLVRRGAGLWLCLPVYDQEWMLKNVKYWNPFTGARFWPYAGNGGKWMLGVQFLVDADPDALVLEVEGESDYLAARAAGALAVGVLAGAKSVPDDLSWAAGRKVVACFDNDAAGCAGGPKQARALIEAGASVWLADISQKVPEDKGDLRDWLCNGDGSPEDLREWMEMLAAEHPLALADLDEAKQDEERVQARYESLQADRAARRLLARDEAAGLWSGFTDDSLAALLAEPRDPTPWIIEGLLRRGHKAVLTAAFKVGKTTLLTNVVRSLVDGAPLFGRFAVQPTDRRVAIFDYELTREDAADLYERVNVSATDRVLLSSLRGVGFSLANDVHAEQVVDYFRRNDVGVWLIDPYARAMRGFGSENSNDDVGAFLSRVDQIAAEAELDAVVISAHTGRGEQLVGSEHARGATKIDDDPDARWIYTKDESGSRFFRAEGRNRVGCEEFALTHDPDTELLTASTLSRSDTKYYAKAQAATRIVLGAGADGMKATELQGHMAGSDEKPKRAVIAFAVRQGWLTEDQRGGRAGTWYSAGPMRFEDKLRLR